MKNAPRLRTYKFDCSTKQPIVLRPMHVSLPTRLFLAAIKALSKLPTTYCRSRLTPDCNERIVEVPFVLQSLASPSGMRILDFGCAESLLPIYLATRGAQVVGVDLRDYDLEHPNFSFEKGDFLDLEFDSASFDAVVAVSAVEHAGLEGGYGSRRYQRGDLRVIRKFRRVLKPDGILLITVPFGTPYVDDELRIYDQKQLDELLEGFTILKRELYRKAPEGAHWLACSEEDATTAGYDQITGVQGVALVVCRRSARVPGH